MSKLRDNTLQVVTNKLGPILTVRGERSLKQVGKARINIRTASDKGKLNYWFDVTPSYYEQKKVDFFIYVCGYTNDMYIFPRSDFQKFILGASLGGNKQVPNFDLYPSTHHFAPCGLNKKIDIKTYHNNFELIRRFNET